MLLENQHPLNKSLTASVIGVPNAGKSCLINSLLGVDLSIVSARPHTTRNRFACVFTVGHSEIILLDTPGVHRSGKEFNRRLNQQARDAVEGADLHLLLIDPGQKLSPQLDALNWTLGRELSPLWIIMAKIDTVESPREECLAELSGHICADFPSVENILAVSSKEGTGMNLLTAALDDAALPGPHLYPDGSISNKNQRFFACEYIREQIFEQLKEELPYESTVLIEDFQEPSSENEGVAHIAAAIVVHRPGQRAIVVGNKGHRIKHIGTCARVKIEAMLNCKVCLHLHVKILSKWFKNHFVLEELGLPRAEDSARSWHKKTAPKTLAEKVET